jgi:hypothetical protein
MFMFLDNVVGDAWLMFLARNFPASNQDIVLLALLFLIMLLVMLLLRLLRLYPLVVPMHF